MSNDKTRLFRIIFSEDKITFDNKGRASINKDLIKLEYNISKVFHKFLNKSRIEKIFGKSDFECFGGTLFKILSLAQNEDAKGYFYHELGITLKDPKNYRGIIALQFEENAANYAMLPWEYLQVKEIPWHLADFKHPFYLSAHKEALFDLVRYINTNKNNYQEEKIKLQQQLTIVQVICSPTDDKVGVTSFRNCFDRLQEKHNTDELNQVFTHQIENVDIGDFVSELKNVTQNIKGEYILHFFGHARMEKNESEIAFVAPDGTKHWISHKQFGGYFNTQHKYKKPCMIILQACESAQLNELGQGLGPTLIEEGIPFVLGMQNEVTADIFMAFFNKFYTALLEGDSIFKAVTTGRVYMGTAHGNKNQNEISDHYNDNSFGTPVIFTSELEGQSLFAGKQKEEEPRIKSGPSDTAELERPHSIRTSQPYTTNIPSSSGNTINE